MFQTVPTWYGCLVKHDLDDAENCWHLYVSVEELSEAMMLGEQTEMVVSQGRDVSHNHKDKEGRP